MTPFADDMSARGFFHVIGNSLLHKSHILFYRKRAPERTKQMKKQGPLTSCDTCGNYVYDDDYGYYLCEADLDEDEMAAFLSSQRFVCPYYQTDDEYKIVRKQM